MRSSVKKVVRILSFFLALTFLVWLLDRIGWDTIGQAFARVGWAGAGVLLLVGVAENIFQAAALATALERRISLLRALTVSGAGTVVNALIPWEAGELLKGALLKEHTTSQSAIHGLVVWNFLMKLSGPTSTILAVMVAFSLGHGIEETVAVLVLAGCVVAFAPFYALRFLLARGMATLVVRILRMVKIAGKDPERLVKAAHELDEKIRNFKKDRPGDYWRILFFQFMARIMAWTSWYVVLRMMGLGYSFALSAMIYAGYSVIVYVTAMVPAKIGVNEGAGYVLFSLYGLDGGTGLIATVIGRVKNLSTNGIAALFAMLGGIPSDVAGESPVLDGEVPNHLMQPEEIRDD